MQGLVLRKGEIMNNKVTVDPIIRSYLREFVKNERIQDPKAQNIAVRIRMTDKISEAGLKENLIFGISDPPEFREKNGKTYLRSDSSFPLEVIETRKLCGMAEIKAFINERGRENCQMMATDPSFDSKVFVYDDTDETMDKLTEDLVERYLLNSDPLRAEPWTAQRIAREDSMFIAIPETLEKKVKAAKDMEHISEISTPFFFSIDFNAGWSENDLHILGSTCLDAYTSKTAGLVIYSGSRKKPSGGLLKAIRESLSFTAAETGEPIGYELRAAGGKDRKTNELLKLLNPATAFQNLSPQQRKALRSWKKTDEEKRKHAILRCSMESDFLQNVVSGAHTGTDDALSTIHSAAGNLCFMMMIMLQHMELSGIQTFFVFRNSPSEEWLQFIRKKPDGDQNAMLKEAFSILSRKEICILLLPDTQAGNLRFRLPENGFLIEGNPEEEEEWLKAFESMHEDITWDIDEAREKEKEKAESEELEKLHKESLKMPTCLKDESLCWDDSTLLSILRDNTETGPVIFLDTGSPLLKGREYRISGKRTPLTLAEIRGEDPFITGFQQEGIAADAGRLFLTLDEGTGIPEEYQSGTGNQAAMHACLLLILAGMDEDNPVASVSFSGKEHMPSREEDPIRVILSRGAERLREEHDPSISALLAAGRIQCRMVYGAGLSFLFVTAPGEEERFLTECGNLLLSPDMAMMKAAGKNQSRTAFKKMMDSLEDIRLRMDAMETIERFLEARPDIQIPQLSPIDHPIGITVPKGTLYGLVENVLLIPCGNRPPKAYISIWSADMSGKYKTIADTVPEKLEKRISALFLLMRSDSKILEIRETESDSSRERRKPSKDGKKTAGSRSVKTISLTREFRHRMMESDADHVSVPRSTEGKVLADINVRKHLRNQACGPGRKDHRLIVIEEYSKRMHVNPGSQITKVIR